MLDSKLVSILANATLETLYMSLVSSFLAFLGGLALAVLLILSDKDSLHPMPLLYKILDVGINVLRSFPFLILIIILFPLTRFLLGQSTGSTAMIVPLSIGIAPFVARIIETAFREVDKGILEAARSFGASDLQIIFKVMLVEALPAIVSGMVLVLIMAIGFSAMAGSIGGGGLGDVAVKYGYYRFQTDVLLATVIILIVLVQLIQMCGNWAYRRLKK
ncbi:MAG: ABC transporter permease [Helicobacter sp.]|nr:ABC transporter permease [Helicobacter sp.]MDE5816664.1 ABC transporter permease [Helicobacter sp.]